MHLLSYKFQKVVSKSHLCRSNRSIAHFPGATAAKEGDDDDDGGDADEDVRRRVVDVQVQSVHFISAKVLRLRSIKLQEFKKCHVFISLVYLAFC